VEIYEELLENKRRDGQVVEELENPKDFHKPHSEKDKFHEIYYYEMDRLDDELTLRIIDWLVFREEVNQIPIVTGGEPRLKD
jgi:hypothetical protein